jgi:hypothetical protein
VSPRVGGITTRKASPGHERDLIAGYHNLMKLFTKQVKNAQAVAAGI